jgi:hypothetical protein
MAKKPQKARFYNVSFGSTFAGGASHPRIQPLPEHGTRQGANGSNGSIVYKPLF